MEKVVSEKKARSRQPTSNGYLPIKTGPSTCYFLERKKRSLEKRSSVSQTLGPTLDSDSQNLEHVSARKSTEAISSAKISLCFIASERNSKLRSAFFNISAQLLRFTPIVPHFTRSHATPPTVPLSTTLKRRHGSTFERVSSLEFLFRSRWRISKRRTCGAGHRNRRVLISSTREFEEFSMLKTIRFEYFCLRCQASAVFRYFEYHNRMPLKNISMDYN